MSALAQLLKDLNNEILGCDVTDYFFTEEQLVKKNIKVEDIKDFKTRKEYIYIIGNAFNEDSEIVKIIKDNNLEYYYYSEFIGNKLNKEIFAVSGTHGKTTTTKFLVSMLDGKTSYIVGDGSGGGYNNDSLVLEACEYKEHFLNYKPKILIINNIEMDHPDYFKSLKQIINTFNKLVNQSDLVLINGDDKNTKKLKGRNIISVGISLENDIVFSYEYIEKGTKIILKYANTIYNVEIPFKGLHIIYDFVMSYVLCLLIGVEPKISELTLPKRRMEEIKYGNTILIDDYAHHPTEIKALHEYISLTYPNVLINVIFQPHTYSRTLKLKKEFIDSLSLYNKVYIDKVFTSTRESTDTYSQLKINKTFKDFNKFKKSVLKEISKDKKEVWVFLGAGIINQYIKEIVE